MENGAVRRVMVGTDRSDSAEEAVQWAASFAERYVAELFVVQVIALRSGLEKFRANWQR
jgi:ubiquinone biosynthesis protein